jgi:recombinational DNA repair ATPase RecF
LDDVFSEFDPERRSHLGELIEQYQTLITTTEMDHLSPELSKTAKVIELK